MATDNASNNDTFINDLRVDMNDIPLIRCMAHIINLSVQDFLAEFDTSDKIEDKQHKPLGKVVLEFFYFCFLFFLFFVFCFFYFFLFFV